MRRFVLALILVGCGESVDTTGLPSVEGYNDGSWYQVTLTGEVPGHLAGRREVFVNDVGRAYGHAGKYRPGTVFVKEIYENEDDTGEPAYISVMRRLDEDDPAAAGLPLDDGWLFTDIEERGNPVETHLDYCWLRCHRAAPVDGAWYDYGAP